jgi:hypothetical protein
LLRSELRMQFVLSFRVYGVVSFESNLAGVVILLVLIGPQPPVDQVRTSLEIVRTEGNRHHVGCHFTLRYTNRNGSV